jgi:hypothetical protein
MTLDDAWFDLSTDYARVCTIQGCDPPTRERKMIGSSNSMLIVVPSRDGLDLIDRFPKGMKFNADYWISHILTPPSHVESVPRHGKAANGKMVSGLS